METMKFFIPAVLFSCAFVAVKTAEVGVCPESYITTLTVSRIDMNIEKCYHFVVSMKGNWFVANHYCLIQGLRLVSIETEEENKALSAHIKSVYSKEQPSGQAWWTSGHDLSDENEWFWFPIGRGFSYKNWNASQPRNDFKNDCVSAALGPNGTLMWSAEYCYKEYPFICEHSRGRVGFGE